jgi:hypothetical protein
LFVDLPLEGFLFCDDELPREALEPPPRMPSGPTAAVLRELLV